MAKTLKNGFCQDVFLSSEELQRERQHPSVEGFVSRSQLGCDVGLSDQRLHCAPAWAQGQLWDFVAFMEAATRVQGSSHALGCPHPSAAAWISAGGSQEWHNSELRGRGCVITPEL